MSATKRFNSVNQQVGFEKFVQGQGRWTLHASDGTETKGKDWSCRSPFGSVESAVVTDQDENPVFDRPVYREAPNVNVVAWGRGTDGIVKVAVIRQPRPHADLPEHPGVNGHDPVMFGQIVMGFLERIVGKDMLERFERVEKGAARETGEETGRSVIRGIERPTSPWHNPNPTFVATWSDLVFVEVDLAAVEVLKHDRNEPIYSAEYITVAELIRRVRDGRDEASAYYRMCTANSAWFIFFCSHPEFFCDQSGSH